jgi:hypothetical protein
MLRFAVIRENVVESIAFSESLEYAQLDCPAAVLVESDAAEAGWLYDAVAESFSPPEGYTAPEVEPQWEQFLGYFSVPGQGGHKLYQAILTKVSESGFAAQDHWQNFKMALSSQNSGVFAASIQYLRTLLSTADNDLSASEEEDWNALMDQFGFSDGCKLN